MMDFPGRHKLIASLDQALEQDCTSAITDALRGTLCHAMQDADIRLPDCLRQSHPEHYARRELYRSERHGYGVVAMTWAPGQGTPVHDHDGMWCVEGVWIGALEIVQYELLAHEEQRYRFQPAGTIQAGAGSAGSLIPPHEYHSIRNPSTTDVAVSVHIYSAPMTRCSVFAPEGADWYRRDCRELALDPTH